MGGVAFCAYKGIIDYMRHHEEADPRPAFIDHVVSTTLVSTGISMFYATRPWHVFCTGFFSSVLVAPFTWWFIRKATIGSERQAPNIFYTNDCTKEEIERYRHQDMIEEAASRMKLEHGYGYVKRGDQAFF